MWEMVCGVSSKTLTQSQGIETALATRLAGHWLTRNGCVSIALESHMCIGIIVDTEECCMVSSGDVMAVFEVPAGRQLPTIYVSLPAVGQ